MAYTNETTHFSIPLPLGSDLTTPMDYNTAAAAVDAALFEAQTNASQAATDASNAVDTANQAASDVGDLGGDLNRLTGRVTALEQSDVIQDNKIDNLEIKVPTKFDSVGIADAYVNGLTYAVGDIVTYNGQRYVCNTAVTAAEPFDADKWTAKDIQAELDQINTALLKWHFKQSTYTTDANGRVSFPDISGVITDHNAFNVTANVISTHLYTCTPPCLVQSTSIQGTGTWYTRVEEDISKEPVANTDVIIRWCWYEL